MNAALCVAAALGVAAVVEELRRLAAACLYARDVGRTPGSAADAPVGLLAPFRMPSGLGLRRDEGALAQRAPRPGGPPHLWGMP